MRTNLYRRALDRASKVLGGQKQLASHLGVDAQSLGKWKTGVTRPPVQVLRSLSEIVRLALLKDFSRAVTERRRLARAAKKRSRR